MVWSGIKKVSYNYVREHRKVIGTRDTIILSAETFHDNNTITWLEHDEIRYDGKMFDVKHKQQSGDEIRLIGHYDKFENKLFKLLNNLLEPVGKNKQHHQSNTFWLPEAIVSSIMIPNHKQAFIEKQKNIPYPSVSYQSYKADSEVQPPEYLLAS
jgi:ATPase subunit of ABC transporter with duplicated ATPase domains